MRVNRQIAIFESGSLFVLIVVNVRSAEPHSSAVGRSEAAVIFVEYTGGRISVVQCGIDPARRSELKLFFCNFCAALGHGFRDYICWNGLLPAAPRKTKPQ